MNKLGNSSNDISTLNFNINEIYIKEEPQELSDENLCHKYELDSDSKDYGSKASVSSTEMSESFENTCRESIKNEEKVKALKTEFCAKDFREKYEGKTEEFHDEIIDFQGNGMNSYVNCEISESRSSFFENRRSPFKSFDEEDGSRDKVEDTPDGYPHSNKKLEAISSHLSHKALPRDFNKHLLTYSSKKVFKCSECDYECNRKDQLKRHYLCHSDTKLFKCSECDFEFNDKSSFKRHLLTHSNTKLFKCTECDYECNQKSDLKRHLLTHSSRKQFKCPECDYECNLKNNLKRHALTHSNAKLFKCSECDYECHVIRKLKSHLLTHPNIRLFKCIACDYECNDKSNFKRHLLTHSNTKLFRCTECEYECNQRGRLNRHLLTHSNTSNTKLLTYSEFTLNLMRKAN